MKPCVPPIDMFSPPWQVFPKYMAALDAFYSMVHSPEFQTYLTLREGELLVMNNWRTMHGRAGLAGKTRTILGGTVTREAAPPPAPPTRLALLKGATHIVAAQAFYSAVREEAARKAGVAPGDEVGIPTAELAMIGGAPGAKLYDAAEKEEQVLSRGYALLRLGQDATLLDMERAARPLLGLDMEDTSNKYNGGGGVTRPTLGDSFLLDAGVGAPHELSIQLHNEMAYADAFPSRIAFAMVRPAEQGGTTTICDNVALTARLSPTLRARMDGGVRYLRILHPETDRGDPLFYMSWEGAFQTEDFATAKERAFGRNGYGSLQVLSDKRRLLHTLWSPVFVTHPVHGELYFSSILNRHGSWLDDHATFGKLLLSDRPYHCLWADGTEISDGELTELRCLHMECTQHLQLARGDVLILDNLRVSHGRTPWNGSSRQLGMLLSGLVPREEHRTPPETFLAGIQRVGRDAMTA